MSERTETRASDDIQVTPEMIEAGMEELFCHDIQEPYEDEMRKAVAAVFRVMANLESNVELKLF